MLDSEDLDHVHDRLLIDLLARAHRHLRGGLDQTAEFHEPRSVGCLEQGQWSHIDGRERNTESSHAEGRQLLLEVSHLEGRDEPRLDDGGEHVGSIGMAEGAVMLDLTMSVVDTLPPNCPELDP